MLIQSFRAWGLVRVYWGYIGIMAYIVVILGVLGFGVWGAGFRLLGLVFGV